MEEGYICKPNSTRWPSIPSDTRANAKDPATIDTIIQVEIVEAITGTYGGNSEGDVHSWYGLLKVHDGPNCVFVMGESIGAAIVLQALETMSFCIK